MKPNSRIARGSRREFLQRSAAVLSAAAAAPLIWSEAKAAAGSAPYIQTVLGRIPADRFGVALAHEHVLCDFIGAGQTGRHRWKVDEVVRRMQPFLRQLRERGVTGFVDCTPAYIGRDPRVLKKLAEETGVHIVTNTGYYGGAGDKFVPPHAYRESAEQLASRWEREWNEGIEDTGVKPGFMKIGVDEAKGDPPQLSEIDAKLVRAAARASRRTGLSVTCHTGGGPAGLAAAKLFIAEGGDPSRFIVGHSDGHGIHINRQAADLGVWVSFDAVSRRPIEQHLKLAAEMTGRHAGRLLLSHDNGWFNAGEENGGEVRDFNYLPDTFIPAWRKAGASDALIRQIMQENPARAFALQNR